MHTNAKAATYSLAAALTHNLASLLERTPAAILSEQILHIRPH
jgi:hypothetical protein